MNSQKRYLVKKVPKMSVSDVIYRIDEKHGVSNPEEDDKEIKEGEEA